VTVRVKLRVVCKEDGRVEVVVGGDLFTGVVRDDYISCCTVLAFEAKAKLAAGDKVGAISVNARIGSRKLVSSRIAQVNIALFNVSN